MKRTNFNRELEKLKKEIKLKACDNSDITETVRKYYERSNVNFNMEKIVGKPVKVENKILYPLIEILSIKNENQKFLSTNITPFAILVKEGENEFAFSLTHKEINPEELFQMIKDR